MHLYTMPRVWRILYAWSRRRPGMKMVISGTPNHDGIWLRPRFTPDEETRYTWVNIETGIVLDHFSQIPKDAMIRPYTRPAPNSLVDN